MQRPISLSLFFPTYNEEENIERITKRALRVAEESPYVRDFEILIVDDGSTDRTPEITDQLQRQYGAVRVIHHKKNQGYGAALVTGLKAAAKEYVFFTDADLQFDLIELGGLLVHVPQYPVVIGYRAPRQDPFMRRANAFVWNRLNRFFFGLQVRDIDCAFKLFKRDLVQSIELKSRGAMISAETLIRLKERGIEIKEIPVTHHKRTAGSPTGAKLSVIAQALREMFELYRGDLGSITQKQFAKFIVVGICNTLLDIGVYYALTRFTPYFLDGSTPAKFLSFLAGSVSSFVFNRTWTFGIRTKLSPVELIRFYAAISIALIVNVVAFYVLSNLLHMYDLLALVLSTGASFVINYALARLWVFRPRAKGQLVEVYQ